MLKSIESGCIDLIYSDILYDTGKNFKDFTDLPPDKKVVYDFYTPRLVEMQRVLKPTGSIYLQVVVLV